MAHLFGGDLTGLAGFAFDDGDYTPVVVVAASGEYIRLYSRITPAVVMPSAICPTVARSSPVAVRRDLRSTIDLESP